MPSALEISNFQRNHPRVALWCTDPENEGHEFFNAVWLDSYAIERVDTLILSEVLVNPHAPARQYDALSVPNGDWTVELDHIRYQFRIHTVINGPLRGNRIIKIKNPTRRGGQYRGFAFLTKSGGIRLWSRFSHHSDEPYVTAVREALRSTAQYQRVDISRCIRCNEAPVADASLIVGLCSTHSWSPDSYVGGNNSIASDMSGEASPSSTRRRATVTPEPNNLPLCQNGTGLVQ